MVRSEPTAPTEMELADAVTEPLPSATALVWVAVAEFPIATELVPLARLLTPMAVLFKTGIFSWNGLLPFWLPFSLFGAWYAAICWTLLRALRCQKAAGA